MVEEKQPKRNETIISLIDTRNTQTSRVDKHRRVGLSSGRPTSFSLSQPIRPIDHRSIPTPTMPSRSSPLLSPLPLFLPLLLFFSSLPSSYGVEFFSPSYSFATATRSDLPPNTFQHVSALFAPDPNTFNSHTHTYIHMHMHTRGDEQMLVCRVGG